MINANMIFYGVKINVDARVSPLSYHHGTSKHFKFTVDVTKDGESLPHDKVYSFPYMEGDDPLKSAYVELKARGEFTDITDT